MKTAYIIITLIIIMSTVCYSRVEKWEIKTYANETLKDVVIESLDNDTLFVSTPEDTIAISVRSIIDIRRKRSKKYIGIGAQSGAVIGGISGFYIKRNSQEEREGDLKEFIERLDFYEAASYFILGAVIGGATGTIVGASLSQDEYYRLASMEYEKKVAVLNMIIYRSKQYVTTE